MTKEHNIDLLKAIDQYLCAGNPIWDVGKIHEAMQAAIKALQDAPDTNVGRWIPCSERLPDSIRPVIVTWRNNDPKSYYQYIVGKRFIGTAHYCKGKWFWYSSTCEDFLAEYGKCDVDEIDEAIEVLAWCEMPEPYKEGE